MNELFLIIALTAVGDVPRTSFNLSGIQPPVVSKPEQPKPIVNKRGTVYLNSNGLMIYCSDTEYWYLDIDDKQMEKHLRECVGKQVDVQIRPKVTSLASLIGFQSQWWRDFQANKDWRYNGNRVEVQNVIQQFAPPIQIAPMQGGGC